MKKRSQVRFPPRRILLDIVDEEEGAHDKDHTIRTIRMRIMKMNMRMNFNIIEDQGQG